jgi:hypothetical protein
VKFQQVVVHSVENWEAEIASNSDPLSPFSVETAHIRDQDISLFGRAATDSRIKLPSNIQPYLPRLLWMYQMGLILFWVYDRSPGQRRTALLFEKTLKMILITLKIAAVPLLRPVHKLAGEVLEAVYGWQDSGSQDSGEQDAGA